MRPRGSAAVTLAALLLASAPAWATPHEDAVSAFDRGRKLRDDGELEKAARMFKMSIALEPSVGAHYNIGLIDEQLGHLREAVDAFRASAALAREKNDPREKDATAQLTKLLATHNHVVLVVPDDVAAANGLRIVVDGGEVPPGRLNGEVFRADGPAKSS